MAHLHPASETSGDSKPHGRVGAKIVCDATSVQYAAYLASSVSLVGTEDPVSFDSDHSGGDGASPFFFFRSVCSLFFSVPGCIIAGGSGKISLFFLVTLLIGRVAGHIPSGPFRSSCVELVLVDNDGVR